MTGPAEASPRYRVVHFSEIGPTECPCGMARRAFTDDPDQVASLHVVDISADARPHYHKTTTEIYYVLEGQGHVELDGTQLAVRPGSCVLIKPGCRHRAVGPLKLINVPIPAFRTDDEWFD